MSKFYFKISNTSTSEASARTSMTISEFETFKTQHNIQPANLQISATDAINQCYFIEFDTSNTSFNIVSEWADEDEDDNGNTSLFSDLNNILSIATNQQKHAATLSYSPYTTTTATSTRAYTQSSNNNISIQQELEVDFDDSDSENTEIEDLSGRIHSLFPTPEQAAHNPNSVYSDHLPILLTVPIGTEGQALGIISLNMLGASASFSGFHEDGGWETVQQAKDRYARTIAALKIAAEERENNVGIITLQEVTTEFCLDTLQEQLGEDWEIAVATDTDTEEERQQPMITCYRSSKFNLLADAVYTNDMATSPRVPVATRNHALQLQDNTTQQVYNINNVWRYFNAETETPELQENKFKVLLNQDEPAGAINIVVGDTNSRIAPLDNNPRNITTGAVPLAIKLDSTQHPDFPDGGFYRNADGHIRQLASEVIRFDNGEIFVDDTNLNTIEKSDPVMVCCLDHSYTETAVIADKTIFAYETALKAQLNVNDNPDDKLLVRVAKNNLNESFVSLYLSNKDSDLAEAIDYYQKKCDISGLTKKLDDNNPRGVIYCVPIAQAHLLHKAILFGSNRYYYNNLNVIDQQIIKLESTKGWILKKDPVKLALYRNLYTKLLTSHEPNYINTIVAWEKETLRNTDNAKAFIRNRNRFSFGGSVTQGQKVICGDLYAQILHVLTTEKLRYLAALDKMPESTPDESNSSKDKRALLTAKIEKLKDLSEKIIDAKLHTPSEYQTIIDTWRLETSDLTLTTGRKNLSNAKLIDEKRGSSLWTHTTGHAALHKLDMAIARQVLTNSRAATRN